MPAVVMIVIVGMRLRRVGVRAGVGVLVDDAAMPVPVATQKLVGEGSGAYRIKASRQTW